MRHDGVSFLFVIGKPILVPRIELVESHFRFTWLFFGLWILSFDMEVMFEKLVKVIEEKKKERRGVRCHTQNGR